MLPHEGESAGRGSEREEGSMEERVFTKRRKRIIEDEEEDEEGSQRRSDSRVSSDENIGEEEDEEEEDDDEEGEDDRQERLSESREPQYDGTRELTSQGDEYIDEYTDSAGEEKVDKDGQLRGSRRYRCKTFKIKGHGEKLFHLGTECSRVFRYRDSYLFFLKNPSLRKYIVGDEEKYDMISQGLIPYAFRSRAIGVVSARSVFKCFGAKAIVSGRRVIDDYFESRARADGFQGHEPAFVEDSHRPLKRPRPVKSVRHQVPAKPEVPEDRTGAGMPKPRRSTQRGGYGRPSCELMKSRAVLSVRYNRLIRQERVRRAEFWKAHWTVYQPPLTVDSQAAHVQAVAAQHAQYNQSGIRYHG